MESPTALSNTIAIVLIAVCLVAPPLSHSLMDLPRRNITFTWKAGAWGACYSLNRCGEGSRERSIRCMDSEGLNALEPNCDSNSRPTSVENCFKVCEEHRTSLRWHVGDWSRCSLAGVDHLYQTTGRCHETTGLAVRNISCIYIPESGRSVKVVESTACEYFEHRPDSEMTCTVPCPQDCVVSNFSDWSVCDSCKVKHRTRVRTVLVAPSGGGKECPPLSEMAPCDAVASCFQQQMPHLQYLLKVNGWGPCQPLDADEHHGLHKTAFTHHPIVGQRTRNLTCLNSEGEIVNMSYCHHQDKSDIEFSQSCIVPQDCVVSPWTEWAVQREGCITSEGRIFPEVRLRTRQLLQLQAGDSQFCPPLSERRIISKDLAPCYKYKWVQSEWEDCVIFHQEEQDYSEILRPLCGGGVQKRNLTCLRVSDLVPVALSFCNENQPVTIQRCNVPCPRNCEVSEWSQWSSCLPSQRKNYLHLPEKGFEERKRTILVEPTPDGIQCPHLHEVNLCNNVEWYRWEYGPWSSCTLKQPEKECGEGTMNRTAKCIKTDNTEDVNVMCELHAELPKEVTDTCYIPCPEDCTVSEWSPWSVCNGHCFEANKQEVQIRNRSILAPAGPSGRRCPTHHDLEDGENCYQEKCTGFHWQTTLWRDCQPLGEEKKCGEGLQQREIYCVHGKDHIVSDRKCELISKPVTEQACNIPCPVDCITTKFSEWSPCPDNCDTETVQSRERYILQRPRDGGKPCPTALREAKVCSAKNELLCLKKSIANLTFFHWDISSWSSCILPSTMNCGNGYQTRKLACIRGDGKEVEPLYCLPQSTVGENNQINRIPKTYRLCFVSCNNNCSLSEWTSWTCDNYCGSVRSRTREFLGPSENHHVCQKYFHTKEEGEVCLASQSISTTTHWLDCIITQNNTHNTVVKVNGETIRGRCGRGYKYRTGNRINETTCLQTGLQEDLCFVECSFDCKMSLWSSWSPCNTTCGMGYRHRRREIIRKNNKFGRPCSATEIDTEIQTDLCNVPCHHYQWIAGLWSNCEVLLHNQTGHCGHGRQFREVICADTRSKNKKVSEDFCDPLLRPDSENPCYLFCPQDCVVSNWSSWSQCSECMSEKHQHRTRKILRKPGSLGLPCPTLSESRECILNDNCFQYKWVLGDWTSCILPEEVICGEGRQQRALSCLRSDGKQVDVSFCHKIEKPVSTSKYLAKSCFVDCPIDCVLSEWSDWDVKNCQICGQNGVRSRYRHIIHSNSDSGQPCPQHLVQHKPCPYHPCYHWQVTPWSECNIEGADCGHGKRYHKVLCVNDNGTVVENEKCLLVNYSLINEGWVDPNWLAFAYDIQEEEDCHIPCPGDCVVTPWSEWSFCHRDCTNGEKVGYQTRSRAVLALPTKPNSENCPQDLWQSRPCWYGPCFTFEWKMVNESMHCVRSDGLPVHGGCQDKLRPCLLSCQQPHARCNHSVGECDCDPGFVPVYALSPQSAEGKDRTQPTGEAESRSGDGGSVRPEEISNAVSTGDGVLEQVTDTVQGHSRRWLIRCEMLVTMDTGQQPNQTTTTEEIILKYYPDDNEASFWMYAMISIGSAFVIFVVVTVYLMCRSTIRQRMVSVQRQASVRRRIHSPEDPNSPWKSSQCE